MRGIVEGTEDEQVLSRHEGDALGSGGGVEVANPLEPIGMVDKDAAGGRGGGFVESQLAGDGYLEADVGAVAEGNVVEADDGKGEYFDVVVAGKVAAGGVDGLGGEQFGFAVGTYQYGIGGQLECCAAVFVTEGKTALGCCDGDECVASGFEMAVKELDGGCGVDSDVVVDKGVDGKGVGRGVGGIVVEGGVAEGVGAVVEKSYGDIGLVGPVVAIDQRKSNKGILVG